MQINHNESQVLPGSDISECNGLFDAWQWNGFGFQLLKSGLQDGLVIAFLNPYQPDEQKAMMGEPRSEPQFCSSGEKYGGVNEKEVQKLWRRDLQTDQIEIDNYLGRVYLWVSTKLYARIPEIIQYGLNQGWLVSLRLRLHVTYRPGEVFSFKTVESRFVHECEHFLSRLAFFCSFQLVFSRRKSILSTNSSSGSGIDL